MKHDLISYSWFTLYVGFTVFKVQIISSEIIMQYAVEYLSENPECSDPDICALAYGVTENQMEDLLIRILGKLKIDISDASLYSQQLNKVKYCAMGSMIDLNRDEIDTIVEKIELIYCHFNYPDDLNKFIPYRNESGFRKFDGTSVHEEIPSNYKDEVAEFLKIKVNELLKHN